LSSTPNLPQSVDESEWFASQIYSHEQLLRSWLLRSYPALGDVDDVIQESYLRVLAAGREQTIASPKAFLFATARNLALDHLRHQGVQRIDAIAEVDAVSVSDMQPSIPDSVALNQELDLLKQAIQSLPDRCRQIVTLRKIYGLSQKQIAAKLGISEHTVEAQGTIGLRKLVAYFQKVDRNRNAGT
jgi:RNA polymerase sigma factor (sigma-70 family)